MRQWPHGVPVTHGVAVAQVMANSGQIKMWGTRCWMWALAVRANARRAFSVTVGILFGCVACTLGADFAWGAAIIDQPAPILVLTQTDGRVFNLSEMRGRVVLVNYWATWCAPCKKEMPLLNAFYRAHHGEGLELIAISADRPGDFAKMRKMSKTLAYPTALFNEISNNGFGTPEGFPLTYVIDRNGIVRDKFIEVRGELLKSAVLPLLTRSPDAAAK